MNKFLVIEAENIKLSEKFLIEEEPSFYNIYYVNNLVRIKYLIPNQTWYLCSILKNVGKKGLTQDLLFDCIKFWKNYTFDFLIDKKTQAARESSLGLFFY